MCLLAQTHVSSSQDTCVFQSGHTCLLLAVYYKSEIFKTLFFEIMTNVPGFILKPYPIIIFPGTFVIILPKVAVEFFRIVQIFSTNNFVDFFFDVEKWNVGDNLKHVFPKFEAERSHPRGVHGRSKFRIFQKCETLNGRLPPEIRSYNCETWGKRVSDDSAFFIFDPEKFSGLAAQWPWRLQRPPRLEAWNAMERNGG